MQLTLFFTAGVSLQTWDSVGMLEREVAIYRRLVEEGIGVRFVTYGDQRDLSLAARIPEIEVTCNRWNLPETLYARLFARIPRHGLQIVKSNQMAGADMALDAAQRAGAPFIARCGYLLSEFQARKHGADSPSATSARQLEARVFPAADRAVVTTPAMRTAIIERYKLDADKVRVIPNYVQTDLFAPFAPSANSRPRLAFVGRLQPQKNLFALLEAVAPLDVELLIVGDGPQRAELEAAAAKGQARVSLLGNLPHTELPALLNGCDLFILPSLYEGHPKVLIEAMSCGLPAIGTRVPGIQELIQDGETGLLCDTSPEGIRGAIRELLGDRELRTRLGRAAREYVLEHFSLDKILELELALYKELAAERA